MKPKGAAKAIGAIGVGLLRVVVATVLTLGGFIVIIYLGPWFFFETGGWSGPFGTGLVVVAGLALVIAFFAAVGFAVAWGFRRGWGFRPPDK